MKKLATLIATAVLGTSSIAAADTFSAQFSGSASIGVSSGPVLVRDHRPDPRPIALPVPAPRPAWFTLGTVYPGKQHLVMNISRPLDRLLLQANGWVYLEKVRIVFGNGQAQTERYNRWVNGAYGGLSIDLAGNDRHIKQVIVMTKSYRGSGTLAVFGRNDMRARPMPASLYGFMRLGPLADGLQTLKVSKNLTEVALTANGYAHIDVIKLHFASGAKHEMTIERDLNASAPLTIALPRYRTDLVSITVQSKANPGVELALFGR